MARVTCEKFYVNGSEERSAYYVTAPNYETTIRDFGFRPNPIHFEFRVLDSRFRALTTEY